MGDTTADPQNDLQLAMPGTCYSDSSYLTLGHIPKIKKIGSALPILKMGIDVKINLVY